MAGSGVPGRDRHGQGQVVGQTSIISHNLTCSHLEIMIFLVKSNDLSLKKRYIENFINHLDNVL